MAIYSGHKVINIFNRLLSFFFFFRFRPKVAHSKIVIHSPSVKIVSRHHTFSYSDQSIRALVLSLCAVTLYVLITDRIDSNQGDSRKLLLSMRCNTFLLRFHTHSPGCVQKSIRAPSTRGEMT